MHVVILPACAIKHKVGHIKTIWVNNLQSHWIALQCEHIEVQCDHIVCMDNCISGLFNGWLLNRTLKLFCYNTK